MVYNTIINLELLIMPVQCELIIISNDQSQPLEFGSTFHDCLHAFSTIGAYSELTLKQEKFLTQKIELSFCQKVAGTMFGHYPLLAPSFVNVGDYINRSPWFHFSTLAIENITQAKTALSIRLDFDDHAISFLFQIAICLIPKSYRVFFVPNTSNSDQRTEITKESVAMHSLKSEGLKQ